MPATAQNKERLLPHILRKCNCSGRLIFLTEKTGQEASYVHPM